MTHQGVVAGTANGTPKSARRQHLGDLGTSPGCRLPPPRRAVAAATTGRGGANALVLTGVEEEPVEEEAEGYFSPFTRR